MWKAKYSLINAAEEIKLSIKEPGSQQGAAPSAAPGEQTSKEEPEKKPQEARIRILVGDPLPVYTSELDFHI